MAGKSTETVKVMIRTRPMNPKEFERGAFYIRFNSKNRIYKNSLMRQLELIS